MKQKKDSSLNSYERLQAILDCSRIGTWEWNVQTGETLFNEAWAAMVGYTLDELAPVSIKTWEKLAHPDDLEESGRLLKRHFAGELPYYDFESRMKHKKGHWVWVHDRGKLISRTDDGAPLLMVGSHGDITERKTNESSLRESDLRFHRMLSAVPDMVSIHDGDMNIVYSNWNGFAAVEESKRLLGTKCYRTYRNFDRICPDCRARQILVTGEPFQEEARLDDGRWVNLRVFPIPDTQGEPTLFVEWVQDITDRKQSEYDLALEKERLMVTLQSIGDGVITTNRDGSVTMMNRAAEAMTGWASQETAGKPLDVVFPIFNEITREPCESPVDKVLTDGRVVELANHTVLVSREGDEKNIADSAAPIRDKDDEIIGVVLVFRDMTEKQRFLEVTQNSQKLESLGILAGGIAHDFNNFLGGIYGYIDLAAGETGEDEEATTYLTSALETIDRARDLTQQLLTFAKGGAPIKKPDNLTPLIRETVQFALSGSNVVCRYDLAPDLWTCSFDRNQVGQVLDNMVINAVQAMPRGGTITVSAANVSMEKSDHPVLAEGPYVRLSLRDSGIGIPHEIRSRIFDPFFSTKAKGHGLGLATCYSIIGQHGGCIDVDSRPGEGSVFHVYLPALREPVAGTDVKESVQRHRGGGTFLVMDDEDFIRDILEKMLASLGYSPVSFKDGEEALAYFTAERKAGRSPAGMIFDLTVPNGMGGREAAARVREIDPDIPVYVASGYADGEILKNPAAYGFTGAIGKPFRRRELEALLEAHLA